MIEPGPILPVDKIDPELEPWVSATQVDTFELCPRKWGFRWLDGLKAPPNKFAQLGLDTHGPMERWLKFGEVPAGNDKPSQLAQALIPYVPPPQAVDPTNVERDELLVVDDVMFIVKVDLYMPVVEYMQRLCQVCDGFVFNAELPDVFGPRALGTTCVNGHGGAPWYEVFTRRPRVYDHKTCGDFKWCVTERDIEYNAQAALYALWAMVMTDLREVDVQWNYVRTKGAIKVKPVFKPITDSQIVPRMEKSVATGRAIKWHLKNTKRALDIVPDPTACDEYGGCPFREQCGITARERIVSIMSDFKNQPSTQQFLQTIGPNGQPGIGPNGQQLVNPPAFTPPTAPAFTPPTQGFTPPAQGFTPPQQQPQFAPPQMPPSAAPQQGWSPPTAAPAPQQGQWAPPAAAPPQQSYQTAPAAQQAPPAAQAWSAPPAAAQPPQAPPWQGQQAAQPPQQQPWQQPAAAPPPAAAPAAAVAEKATRSVKSKEYDLTGAWARFAAAALTLPNVQGNPQQAALVADALVAELKARQ